jgi:hypothetical protein
MLANKSSSRANVVALWIAGTTAPVSLSMRPNACAASVSASRWFFAAVIVGSAANGSMLETILSAHAGQVP